MIQLYGHNISGNSYKVKLFLSFLNLEYEWIFVDLRKNEHKSPEFLQLNPLGQVPVLVDGATTIRDSQAILVYLARRYGGESWFPTEAVGMSLVVQWLTTSANEVFNGLAMARIYHLLKRTEVDIELATAKAQAILRLLEQHLTNRQWLELERLTIADIAMFPYVALAPDGKIDLVPYPNVVAWIERIKGLPGFVGMRGIEVLVAE